MIFLNSACLSVGLLKTIFWTVSSNILDNVNELEQLINEHFELKRRYNLLKESFDVLLGNAVKLQEGICLVCENRECKNKPLKFEDLKKYNELVKEVNKILKNYKWKVALPAPTLYGQFDELEDADYVLHGLLQIGFDDVVEVSHVALTVFHFDIEVLESYLSFICRSW